MKKAILSVFAVLSILKISYCQTVNTSYLQFNTTSTTNRTVYQFNGAWAGVYDAQLTGYAGALPLIDFSWTLFDGSGQSKPMILKNTGLLLLGPLSDDGSHSKLQIFSGNPNGPLTPGISLGQYGSSNTLKMGIWYNQASFLQSSFPLSLNPQGFNVGVGTVNPLSLLQVGDGFKMASFGSASGSALNSGTSYLGFNAARKNDNTWTVHSDGGRNGGGMIYSSISGDMYFAAIESSGNVDKTLSDADIANRIKFHIAPNGTAYAQQVIVQTNIFPDYVFDKDYDLVTLKDVKSYINKHHHLPEIPSADEVARDGVNLGEMNAKLLKKIEELTLYLIEKDKQLNDQQDQLNKIKNKLGIK